MPGIGSAITSATDAVPVPSMGTATEVGPLTSSPPRRGHSLNPHWGLFIERTYYVLGHRTSKKGVFQGTPC
jgi:hypothetical protein